MSLAMIRRVEWSRSRRIGRIIACSAITACSGSTLSLQTGDGGGTETGASGGGSSGMATSSGGSSGSGSGMGVSSGSSSGMTTSSGSSSGMAGSGSSSGTAGSDAGGSSGPKDAGAHDATAPDSAANGSDAATGDAAMGGDAGACAACGSGTICVEDLVVGGAFVPPDDAGQCPGGRVILPQSPRSCSSPPTFHCAAVPSACTTGSPAPTHCACVPSICASGYLCTDLTLVLTLCEEAVP